MKNMTILCHDRNFVDNANIQGQLRTMLNTGIDSVTAVPVDGMQALAKHSISNRERQLSLAGIKANGDFSPNESGGRRRFNGMQWTGAMALLLLQEEQRTDRSSNFAYAKVLFGKMFLVSAARPLLPYWDATGLLFTTSGKIANALKRRWKEKEVLQNQLKAFM